MWLTPIDLCSPFLKQIYPTLLIGIFSMKIMHYYKDDLSYALWKHLYNDELNPETSVPGNYKIDNRKMALIDRAFI